VNWEDVGKSVQGLFHSSIPEFAFGDWEKPRQTSRVKSMW